ncbi:MFS transporter [Streptomyces sp. NPDC056549]|uniref:MFS transporter n=1 Tax=Streptomyces sp. NPDC056549 TaxID=3345864 RepID=UPI0036BA5843
MAPDRRDCPAAGGVVVEAVPKEMRHGANALLKIGQNTVNVGGQALGGVLVAVAGPAWVIGGDALTFAAAAVWCAKIKLAPGRMTVRERFVSDLRERWYGFWSRTWLWIMVVQSSVIVPIRLVRYQLQGPVYGQRILGGSGPWGVIASGFTGSLIAGAALALMWKPQSFDLVVCLGTGSMALPLAAMTLDLPILVLIGATAAAGSSLAVSMTTWAGLVQERTPKNQLSRITSYSTLGQILPVPISHLAAGPAAELLGVRVDLAMAAMVIAMAAVSPLLLCQIRELSQAVTGESVDAELTSASRGRRRLPRAAASDTSPSRMVPIATGLGPSLCRWRQMA